MSLDQNSPFESVKQPHNHRFDSPRKRSRLSSSLIQLPSHSISVSVVEGRGYSIEIIQKSRYFVIVVVTQIQFSSIPQCTQKYSKVKSSPGDRDKPNFCLFHHRQCGSTTTRDKFRRSNGKAKDSSFVVKLSNTVLIFQTLPPRGDSLIFQTNLSSFRKTTRLIFEHLHRQTQQTVAAVKSYPSQFQSWELSQ